MSKILHPVKVTVFRKFLKSENFTYKGIKGDHEKWIKSGFPRPVIFPVKKKEINQYVIASNLKTIGISIEDFLQKIKNL